MSKTPSTGPLPVLGAAAAMLLGALVLAPPAVGHPQPSADAQGQESLNAGFASARASSAFPGWSADPLSVEQGGRLVVRAAVARGLRRVSVQVRDGRQGWTEGRRVPIRNGRAVVRIAADTAGQSRYRLTASRSGTPIRSKARSVRVVAHAAGWADTRFAVGDIGDCAGDPAATAALIPDGAGLIALGDIAYPSGTPEDFRRCFLPHFSRLIPAMRSVPGNHDYYSGGAGYFDTFAGSGGTKDTPWYEWETGPWRILMLDSSCDAIGGCGKGSRQYTWLRGQLRDNPRRCVAAAWHHPVYSSGEHGPDPSMRPLLRLLVRSGADLVLNGHDHDYERFARMDAGGHRSSNGVRTFVVGTGGAGLRDFTSVQHGSQVRFAGSHGVLRLDLADGSYRWKFLSADGSEVDSGAQDCG